MTSSSDRFDRLQAVSDYPLGTEALAPEISPLFNVDPELPAAEALSLLPYVSPDGIERKTSGHDHYLQHQRVRVERIVGGNYNVLGSWIGNCHKETQDGPLTSLEHAQNLAYSKIYELNNHDFIWLKPFVDLEGDVWFRADHGAHRVMAAKINAEELLIANIIEPDRGRAMDFYAGTVIQEALEKAERPANNVHAPVTTRPWMGRISLWSLLRPAGTDGLEDKQRTRYLR